jgi:glycosyltransferase involved in cell wall biosynthesis
LFLFLSLALRQPCRLFKLVCATLLHHRTFDQFLKTLWKLPRAVVIAMQLSDSDYDVEHLFWGNYPSLVFISGNLLSLSKPRVRTMFLGAYDLRAEYSLSRIAAELCQAVVTHVSANLDDITALGIDASNVHVIYRGIDLHNFPVEGRETKSNDIIMAGRLVSDKAFLEGVRLFKGLVDRDYHGTLVIFGDGPERARLEAEAEKLGISDRVNFKEFGTQHELFEVMKGSRALFHPSLIDHLPNVVKEALWAGCFCVVSPSKGISELVSSDALGVIVDYTDPALVDEVFERLRLDDLYEQVDDRRERIRTLFDASRQMRTYVALWAALGKNNRERNT